MESVHNLGILSIKKSVNENAGFLLANKKGSYCSFFNAPASRYYGLFYFDEKTMNMYKFIENIEIIGSNGAASLKNGFYFAERKKGNLIESFLMPKGFNSLIYELSSYSEIDVILDCKDAYDNREWGRHYEISEEQGCIVIKFTKKTDWKEDSSDNTEEFVLHLAIKSSSNSFQKNGKWIERDYSNDEERKSFPFKRHVYSALRMKGSKFVFSMSKNKDNAIRECGHIFNNAHEIKNREKEHFFDIVKKEPVKKILQNDKISNEIKIAYVNALNSLDNLAVNGDNYGIFAGLPWFFQFWSRDTLVSLKALSKIDDKLAKRIFFRYLNKIDRDGRLPNLIGRHKSISLGSADAHGWLFLRCRELIEKINYHKETIGSIKKSMAAIRQTKHSKSARISGYLKNFSLIIRKKENEHHNMAYEIESSLEKSLDGLLKFHAEGSFEANAKSETWMDTEFLNDARDGVRTEIQALRLGMYRLMFEMTQNHKYKVLENLLKNKVRDRLWNNRILADGLNDFTIRPNIFIAAYAYPELLSANEWEECFGNALKGLWLGWGGLKQAQKRFCGKAASAAILN